MSNVVKYLYIFVDWMVKALPYILVALCVLLVFGLLVQIKNGAGAKDVLIRLLPLVIIVIVLVVFFGFSTRFGNVLPVNTLFR